MSKRTGHCLCGAVHFTALIETNIAACHCSQCQRWTGGGPLLSVRAKDLALKGEEALQTYRHSTWGERVFCGTCGSTITWKMQGKPIGFVAVGLLDNQSGLAVREEIFADCRAPWLQPWPEASQSTEAEEMAKLDAYLEKERPQ